MDHIIFISLWSLGYYATSSTEQSVYIIGGYINGQTQTPIIAEYKNDEWYNIENLKQARHGHGVITSGSLTMVIGGSIKGGQLWVLINSLVKFV